MMKKNRPLRMSPSRAREKIEDQYPPYSDSLYDDDDLLDEEECPTFDDMD